MTNIHSAKRYNRFLITIFRVLLVGVIGVYGAVTVAERVVEPLRFDGARVHSIDVPLADRNRVLDILTRAPVGVLAVVPEKIQVEVGLWGFLSGFTRGLSSEVRTNISASVRALYTQMDNEPEWRDLPSVTGYAATDIVGIPPQRAHAFVYVPTSAHRKPKRAVLFLHGALGGLKAYPYLWSRYAEDTQSLIVCATFGFGKWGWEENTLTTIMNSLPRELQVPRSETIIVGLSAGGYGVVKELQRHSDYRAAVFISAVMPDVSMIEGLSATWGSKPFLLFHGGRDFVVTKEYAVSKESEYRSFGASLEVFPNETHFLFMTQAPVILQRIQSALYLPPRG